MEREEDLIAELEREDRVFNGEEEGEVPLAVLRARGLVLPENDAGLDDAALHAKLWEVIEAMANLGMVLEFTDHLTDRELYRYLVREALVEETILPGIPSGTWHLSPIGGGSEEDIANHLRFYADDAEREEWHRDWGDPLPPREPLRADRDRLLPTAEVSRTIRRAQAS